MNWRNWKNHPFIFTLVGALLLGYLVRKFTEPAPYRYTYDASRPVATTPAPKSAPTPALKLVSTPAPVLVTPAAQSAPAATRPMASSPSTFSPPVDLPYNSTTRVSSGRRGYTTYTFKIEEISYVLDGEAAFDHLGEMKQRASVFDPEITRLRAECAVLQSQIDASKSQLDYLRSVLDRTDQSAIDGFNAKVRESNAIIGQRRAKVAELNAIVDQFNEIVSAMHVYAQQHRR
jgi:hypothetical protein